MITTQLAPIALFCYNRPLHLQETLEALRRNPLASQSELVVFADGPKDEADAILVREVRALLDGTQGFGHTKIKVAEHNQGLARSVIKGVSELLENHEKVIVLEDDMLCTTDFLDYMNSVLTVYQGRPDIFSVTGYTPPISLPAAYGEEVYLVPRASSWGWGTWRDRWRKADWQVEGFEKIRADSGFRNRMEAGGEDLWPMLVKQQRGQIDSWAIRWTYSQVQHQAYGLYPAKSKIKNIGTDGSGTNFTFKTAAYGQELVEGNLSLPPDLQPEPTVVEAFRRFYSLPWRVKLKNRIKHGI
ncbi:glycosyltransferase [Persicitalea sp.]|uniref:glycosyltransferase n=1 Tax=Persicitalea sp. TaxID=3100273 RepID=UPI0035934B1D